MTGSERRVAAMLLRELASGPATVEAMSATVRKLARLLEGCCYECGADQRSPADMLCVVCWADRATGRALREMHETGEASQ